MRSPRPGGGAYHQSYFRNVMTDFLRYRTTEDLPQTFPIFPLPRALLLPRGRLPLQIFEPRYLDMVDDALSSKRLIGMIQPCDVEGHSENPKLFTVGCIGRITAFKETKDQRYYITLTGVCRYRIEQELDCVTLYRQVSGNFLPYPEDLSPEKENENINRPQLISALKTYLAARQMNTDWASIENASNEGLVNSLSIIGDFDVGEKQMLLEAPTLPKRAEILTALIEFANAPSTGSADAPLQ